MIGPFSSGTGLGALLALVGNRTHSSDSRNGNNHDVELRANMTNHGSKFFSVVEHRFLESVSNVHAVPKLGWHGGHV